jgi:hypothetical protein
MVFALRNLVLAVMLIGSNASSANENEGMTESRDFYEIASIEIREISATAVEFPGAPHTRNLKAGVDAIANIGSVIALGRDLVALGEEVYNLVEKGKPTVKTNTAPISVLPRVAGQPVDIFDTENWTAPVKRTYEIKYDNLYGVTIVHFKFSVMYSHGGTYNGVGAYLTSVQVVPEYVKVLWGWNFDATMRLGGIQNQGTSVNPVAGATVMIQYTTSSLLENIQRTTSFFVTGKGELKML